MRLIFATIVAAATLSTLATPALADGERGHDDRHGGHSRGDNDGERGWSRDHDGERGWNRHHRHHNNFHTNRHHQSRFQGHHDRRGSSYWGPSERHWSRWDNSWGDPHRYARQWGFDRYDHNRGWQRGNTWYASPSHWNDWGGWNWSFSWGSNNFVNHGHTNFGGNNHYSNNQCRTYRTEAWVNGRRALVTYLGCADQFGRIFEQPGTRRIEQWLW